MNHASNINPLKKILKDGSAKNAVAQLTSSGKKRSWIDFRSAEGFTSKNTPIIVVAIAVTEDMGQLLGLIKSLRLLGANIQETGRAGSKNNARYWLNKVHGSGTGAIDKRGDQYNKIVAYLTACGVPAP